MADVSKLVEDIRSKLTDEQRSEVGSVLETIKTGYLEKVDEAKAAVSESMERKRKLRETKEIIEDLTLDRDEFKKKYESHDDSELIKERDKYKQKWSDHIATVQEGFNGFYEKAKETENWGKVASEYYIPEEGKELTPEQIESNVEKMTYHQRLGLFDEAVKPNPPTNKSFRFSDEKVPTTAEYHEIRDRYGPSSPEAVKAMKLIRESKG